MFEELGKILADAGLLHLPVEEEDLVDFLWLARRVPSGPAAPLAAHLPRATAPQPSPPDPVPSSRTTDDDAVFPAAERLPAALSAPAREPARRVGVVSRPVGPSAAAEAVRTPGTRALGPSLPLGRALRPLKRLVANHRRTEFDEEATAERQADTGVTYPVLRPERERWLRLVLIIDSGVSMLLWERHCAEFRAHLEHSGAFREVQTYQIRYDTDGAGIRLGPPWSTATATRPADTVVDGSGRTMVLVVTDGAAAAWSDGRLRPLLEAWARRGPTAVVHTLPRRLWAGSGVGADTWRVTSPRPGAPNTAWAVADQLFPPEVAPPPSVPVPVLELTADSLATWTAVNTVVGRPVPVPLWTAPRPRAAGDARPAVPVTDFARAASPEALRLAAHLAAMAPVTVPVMRLVHTCLDQGQDPTPLAEVLLGGLLHALPPVRDIPSSGRHRLFDFTPQVKDLLLDAVPTAELIDCARRVGDLIESLAGRSSDFPAWPLDPDSATTAAPFAYLGPEFQARLGLRDVPGYDSTPAPSSFGGSLRLLFDSLGIDGYDFMADADMSPAELDGYFEGRVLPPWHLVTELWNTLATRFGEQTPEEKDRLRAEYAEAVLSKSTAEVRGAFDRVRRAGLPPGAGLLLPHLIHFVDPHSGALRGEGTYRDEREVTEDLWRFLRARGIEVVRERRGRAGRSDGLVWLEDGQRYVVKVSHRGSPFTWPGIGGTPDTDGSVPVVFVVAVDDDDKPDGPLPVDDCVVVARADGRADSVAPVVWLRLQNGVPALQQRVCVAVDIVGFSDLPESAQMRLWEIKDTILVEAARAAGVAADEFRLESRGDGAVMLLPPGVDESATLPAFLDGLGEALRRTRAAGDPMRLRVAVHQGPAVADPFSTGETVVHTARLLDSAVLRAAVDADRDADLAVVVSDPLCRKVPALQEHFQRVRVDLKNYRAWAWLRPALPERPRPPGLPDRSRSNAVLVGAGVYDELPELPQVLNGLRDLAGVLTDPSDGAFARDRTAVLANPESTEQVLDEVRRSAAAAEDTLLVYLAGHGLFDPVNGDLSLAVRDTRPHSTVMAVPVDHVRDAVRDSQARHKMIILDCYYAGAARIDSLPGVLNIEPFPNDVLMMAASAQDTPAPSGGGYTAFTGGLIDILNNGLPDGPEVISLDLLFREADRRLGARGLRRPTLGGDAAGGVGLARNRAR
ncbi:SAV_2336 N-terminal domain-related protein [Streptomyces sp. NPDC000345]|uniref:caspase, EACC1-associated type n=1 Tax=Streptomyces sp. NPDC000345 TaxID=3364537 RepID=UPI0036BDACDF